MTDKIERFGICFSAPSGAGKNTIINKLKEELPVLKYLVSATTRAKRGDEKDGVSYYFLTDSEFKKKIQNNEFIEHEEVYGNRFYGTLYTELESAISKKTCPTFDIDVKGAKNLKEKLGENMLSILILPESIEQLEKQILARKDNTNQEELEERLGKANFEIEFGKTFADHIVVNKYGYMNDAINQLKEICTNFLQTKNLWVPQ